MKISSPDGVSIEITRYGAELILTLRRPGSLTTKMAFDVKEAVTIRNTIAACLPGMKSALPGLRADLHAQVPTHLPPPPAPEIPGFTGEARPAAIGAPQEPSKSPEALSAELDRAEQDREAEKPV